MVEGSVYQLFAARAASAPDRPFLCYPATVERGYCKGGAEWSYGQALSEIDRVARMYSVAGYRSGHRVALAVGNRPEHFWHYLGLNSLGVTVVTQNPDYLPHEFAYGVSFPGCALIVTSQECRDRVFAGISTLSTTIPILEISGPGHIPPPGAAPHGMHGEGGDQIALIIYTSGTTGKPKGCMISNASCLAAGNSYASAGGPISFLDGGDRIYIPLPAFHMNVSVYTLTSAILKGNCLVLQDRFRASHW